MVLGWSEFFYASEVKPDLAGFISVRILSKKNKAPFQGLYFLKKGILII